jgi:hypothetical protein
MSGRCGTPPESNRIPHQIFSHKMGVLGFKYSADYIIIVIDRILEEYFPNLS